MRKAMYAFAVAALIYLVTMLIIAVAGPAQMPMHAGLRGGVDAWGSKGRFLLNSTYAVVIAAFLLILAANVRRFPASIVNTPHRDYWLTEEHRPRFDRLVASMMIGIAALQLLLFSAINIAGMWVRHESWYYPTALVLFFLGLASVIGSTVVRLYREPGARRR